MQMVEQAAPPQAKQPGFSGLDGAELAMDIGTSFIPFGGAIWNGLKAGYHGLTGQGDKAMKDLGWAAAGLIPGGALGKWAVKGVGMGAKLGRGAITVGAGMVPGMAAEAGIDRLQNGGQPNPSNSYTPQPNPYTGGITDRQRQAQAPSWRYGTSVPGLPNSFA